MNSIQPLPPRDEETIKSIMLWAKENFDRQHFNRPHPLPRRVLLADWERFQQEVMQPLMDELNNTGGWRDKPNSQEIQI